MYGRMGGIKDSVTSCGMKGTDLELLGFIKDRKFDAFKECCLLVVIGKALLIVGFLLVWGLILHLDNVVGSKLETLEKSFMVK